MMRELDTVSPVVWPSWCYSGEGQGDSEPGSAAPDHHQQQQPSAPDHHQQQSSAPDHHQQQSSAPATVATPKPRGKRRGGAATMNGGTNNVETQHHNNNNTNNNNNNSLVKTERLSPTATTTSTTTTTTNSISGAGIAASNTPDNNSSSSRSATPSSSYPGTPPGGLPAERGGSPSSGHIKHMEQMMTRNYSDFMRSLAAKYNNANPNDYFSTPSRNGFPVGLDSRFTSFKTGTTPFVGLMSPLGTATMPTPGPHKNNIGAQNNNIATTSSSTPIVGTTASSKDSILDSNHLKKPSAASVEAQQALYAAAANFSANPFGTGTATTNPMFPPLIDMSSTQALLSMVRTANAHSASQLETYLKGAIKRPPPSESSPLDLSSAALPAYAKRTRTSKGLISASENIFLNSDSLLHVPMVDALRTTKDRLGKRTGSVSPKLPLRHSGANSAGSSPRLLPSSTATSAGQQNAMGRNLPCLSMCSSDRGCASSGDAQIMAQWSVEDVCGFVSSIDICAEYVPNFREQRIDGSSLPLLTEEHLTNTLGMKLGPALKLRSTLSRRLGNCAICMHCVHCHRSPSSLGAATVSPAQTPPSVVGRPNSTGN